MQTNNPFGDLPELVSESNSGSKQNDELTQQSKEWFLHRWDKFTGSEIPDLMKQGRGKNAEWGETAKKVILKKVSYERMSDEGRDMQAEIEMKKDFVQCRWGNTYEPIARAKYCELTGLKVVETGFTVNPNIPFNGASFDGTVICDKNNIPIGIIEIKCPYDPNKHESNATLKELDVKHEYYGQIQNNINVAGVEWCDFISFDPRKKDEYSIVIIRVMRDQLYIDAVKDRLNKAQQIKNKVLGGMDIDSAIQELNTNN